MRAGRRWGEGMITQGQGRYSDLLETVATESFHARRQPRNFRILTLHDFPLRLIQQSFSVFPGQSQALRDLTLIQFGRPSFKERTKNYKYKIQLQSEYLSRTRKRITTNSTYHRYHEIQTNNTIFLLISSLNHFYHSFFFDIFWLHLL